MNQRNFFAQLKRRNVYKVAVAYAVVAWLLIQIATQTFPFFEVPNWSVRLVILLLIIGFPVALIVAWAFELTPGGIKRTDDGIEGSKHRASGVWAYVVLISAAFSVGLFFVGRYTAGSTSANTSAVPEKSIAVVPLVNQSEDPNQEYFSDGLSEELINVLGQIRELRVIGRNSSFRFKGKSDDSRAIGQALRVANVLEGSVRKAGDRVRISVELVNTADDSQRWSQTYDRELKDVFAVQEEIAKSVADQLRVTLMGGAGNALARPSNQSLEAYNAYLQGQFYLGQRNAQGFAKALSFWDEAIRLDPNYADVYAGRARVLSSMAFGEGIKGKETFEQARQAAKTALALKPGLPLAHATLGYVYLMADWDTASAEKEVSRIETDNPVVLNTRALVRKVSGDFEGGAALQRKMIDLDPEFVTWQTNFASTLLQIGRYDEAESALRKAMQLQPGAKLIHFYLSLLAVLRGQGDVALREAQLEPDAISQSVGVAVAEHVRGDRAQADAALGNLISTHGENFPSQVAFVYAGRGEPDKVFEWLNRAYLAHQPTLTNRLLDPLLKPYRSDPRFVELCRKTNLPVPK